MTAFIHVLSAAAFVAAVWVAVAAWKMRRNFKRAQEQLLWVHKEATRAVDLLHSDDHDRIIIGLQTLGVLNVREARLDALQKIAALAKSDDPTVAAYASDTLAQVLPEMSRRRPPRRAR